MLHILALLDCISRANAVARAAVVRQSIVRKTRFLFWGKGIY